jgi:hypothetical protein
MIIRFKKTIILFSLLAGFFHHGFCQVTVVFASRPVISGAHGDFDRTLKGYFKKGNCRYMDNSDLHNNPNPFAFYKTAKYLFLLEEFRQDASRVSIKLKLYEGSMDVLKLTMEIKFFDFKECQDWFIAFQNDIVQFNGNFKGFGKMTYIRDVNFESLPISEQLMGALTDIKCQTTRYGTNDEVPYFVVVGTQKKRNYDFINPYIEPRDNQRQKFSCDITLNHREKPSFHKPKCVIKTYVDTNELFAKFCEDFATEWLDDIYAFR